MRRFLQRSRLLSNDVPRCDFQAHELSALRLSAPRPSAPCPSPMGRELARHRVAHGHGRTGAPRSRPSLPEPSSSGDGTASEARPTADALSLLSATDTAALVLGQDLRVEWFTDRAAVLFDLGPQDLDRPFAAIATSLEGPCMVEAARRARRGDAQEHEVRRPGGPEQADRWFVVRARPWRPAEHTEEGVVLTATNITERRALEQSLAEAEEQMQRRIGQDLHDMVCSDLAGAVLLAESLRRALEEKDLPEAEVASTLQDVARRSAERSRSLSHTLVPPALQEQGLARALDCLCQEQESLGDFACVFEREGPEEEGRQPLCERPKAAAHLYHIATEAVTNARRHADPDRVQVVLGCAGGRLVLKVQDDGTGLPDAPEAAEGVGLRTMRARARLVGASLSVESGDADGTVVRCTLPLDEAPPERRDAA